MALNIRNRELVKELAQVISKRCNVSPEEIINTLDSLNSVDKTLLAINIAAANNWSLINSARMIESVG